MIMYKSKFYNMTLKCINLNMMKYLLKMIQFSKNVERKIIWLKYMMNQMNNLKELFKKE